MKYVQQIFFSIIADEATDSANDEQLAISIRYVNPRTYCIEERFVAFSECLSSVSGEAIASQILKLLNDWQLSPTNLRGQVYDGAGAWLVKKEV